MNDRVWTCGYSFVVVSGRAYGCVWSCAVTKFDGQHWRAFCGRTRTISSLGTYGYLCTRRSPCSSSPHPSCPSVSLSSSLSSSWALTSKLSSSIDFFFFLSCIVSTCRTQHQPTHHKEHRDHSSARSLKLALRPSALPAHNVDCTPPDPAAAPIRASPVLVIDEQLSKLVDLPELHHQPELPTSRTVSKRCPPAVADSRPPPTAVAIASTASRTTPRTADAAHAALPQLRVPANSRWRRQDRGRDADLFEPGRTSGRGREARPDSRRHARSGQHGTVVDHLPTCCQNLQTAVCPRPSARENGVWSALATLNFHPAKHCPCPLLTVHNSTPTPPPKGVPSASSFSRNFIAAALASCFPSFLPGTLAPRLHVVA